MDVRARYLSDRLEIAEGDITKATVDAIVNAANRTLLGGGGVDGAIHRAAGPQLRSECAKLGGCATGQAKITRGYRLPAGHVIHTVGPVWRGGAAGEDELLASCYRRSFELCVQHGLRTVAVPAVSTGAYGFPVRRAAKIAVEQSAVALGQAPSLERIVLCCFSSRDADTYVEVADETFGQGGVQGPLDSSSSGV